MIFRWKLILSRVWFSRDFYSRQYPLQISSLVMKNCISRQTKLMENVVVTNTLTYDSCKIFFQYTLKREHQSNLNVILKYTDINRSALTIKHKCLDPRKPWIPLNHLCSSLYVIQKSRQLERHPLFNLESIFPPNEPFTQSKKIFFYPLWISRL